MQIRQYDLGVSRESFLTSLGTLQRDMADLQQTVLRTAKWLADAKMQSEDANVAFYTAELAKLASTLDSLKNHLPVVESQRSLRMAFSRGVTAELNAGDVASGWNFGLVIRRPNGEVVRYPSTGAFEGVNVERAYDRWREAGLIVDPPHETLGTNAARRWLIEEMLQSERKWVGRWKADPVTLLRKDGKKP